MQEQILRKRDSPQHCSPPVPGRQQVAAAATWLLPLPSKKERKRAAPKVPFWHVQRGRGWRHQVSTGTSLFS